MVCSINDAFGELTLALISDVTIKETSAPVVDSVVPEQDSMEICIYVSWNCENLP